MSCELLSVDVCAKYKAFFFFTPLMVPETAHRLSAHSWHWIKGGLVLSLLLSFLTFSLSLCCCCFIEINGRLKRKDDGDDSVVRQQLTTALCPSMEVPLHFNWEREREKERKKERKKSVGKMLSRAWWYSRLLFILTWAAVLSTAGPTGHCRLAPFWKRKRCFRAARQWLWWLRRRQRRCLWRGAVWGRRGHGRRLRLCWQRQWESRSGRAGRWTQWQPCCGGRWHFA